MLPEIKNTILILSSSMAVAIFAKATLITALGLIAARLARDSRASVRYALLAVTFGALLALPAASQANGTDGPFFTAVREQLGLRLEPRKSQVVTYVIEKVERPAEN
jgi:Protein of unknown function (DUF3738)